MSKTRSGKCLATLAALLTTLSALLATLTAPFATLAHAQAIPVDRVMAVVDDDVVLKSEFDERWAQVQAQLAQQTGPLPPTAELRKQVLDQIILEHLQLQLAERAGVRVDDNELNAQLQRIAQGNNLTFEQFRDLLDQQGLYESTREALRNEMLIGQLQGGAVNRRIEISRQEVENYLRSEAGMTQIAPEYRIAHVLIPNSPGVSAGQQAELAALLHERIVDGADIRQIAASGQISGIPVNGGELNWGKVETLPSVFRPVVPTLEAGEVSEPFTSPNGQHIVQVLETRGGVELTQEQSRVRHILIKPNEIRTEAQAEALIRELHRRIVGGEDFGDVARQNTDDVNSMVAGGNLEWIADGMLPPDFMDVVKNTPVGELTEPFRASTGWHIVEVLDRRMQDVTEENKRFQAERILRERKFESELQNWLTEMRDTHYIDIKDPEFAEAETASEPDAEAEEDDEDTADG